MKKRKMKLKEKNIAPSKISYEGKATGVFFLDGSLYSVSSNDPGE